MDFQSGDTVRLKSGGPVMTVDSIDDGEIYVVWFDSKNSVQNSAFRPSLLEKTMPAKSSVELI